MNHCEPPHLRVNVHRALRHLSLLLLPAMAPTAVHSLPRARPPIVPLGLPRESPGAPYLAVLGAPPLRFERPAPPPDIVTRPPAAAPPIPALTPTETTVAEANVAAVQSATISVPPPPMVQEVVASVEQPSQPPKPGPTAILPDDTRSSVRPEDFLPYFQVPGSAQPNHDTGRSVPNSSSVDTGSLPPSSATYTQTKK